jgi:predicted DNA-binding transcriptional regulator AlpA
MDRFKRLSNSFLGESSIRERFKNSFELVQTVHGKKVSPVKTAPPLTDLDQEIREAPVDTLPVLIGELERLKAIACARLYSRDERPVPTDELLTAEEAAARLSVPKRHLYRKTYPFRVQVSPGRVRFSSLGIDRWIQRRSQKSHSPP